MTKREELMASLRSVKWGEFEIGELFDISRGRNFPKSDWKSGSIPIITTTGLNNGITDFISNPNDKVSKNSLTVAGTGTVGSTFYHEYEHNVGEWVLSLTLKDKDLNKHLALFLTTVISYQKDKYSYAYKLGNERLSVQKILLPVDPNGNPDWNFMDEYMRMVEESVRPSLGFTEHVITDNRELEDVEWDEFNMTDVFDVKDGYYNKKPPVSENGTIPFLGATAYNNGVTDFVTVDAVLEYDNVGNKTDRNIDRRIFDGNCIVIINDGSVGNVYYQTSDFTCSHSVTPIYLKGEELNKHLALFLSMMLRKTAESFSYARKWRPTRIRKSKLILPVTPNGEPDWNFMEQYMKRIENDIMKDINIKHKQHVAVVN